MKAEDVKLICAGRCTVGADWKNTASGGMNRLYYIEGGSGGYVKSGERIPFETGKLYLIPYYANIITYTDLIDNLDHSFVAFTAVHPILTTDVLMIDPHAAEYVSDAVEIFRSFCRINYLRRLAPSPYPREDELRFLRAITAYLTDKLIKAHNDSFIEDQTVISALDMMTESLESRLTVADIAERHGMTPNGFIKRFTRYVGETPYSYMKNLKIRTALMLREDGMTLEKAAEACGYSDASALLHAISSARGERKK